jgi:hypothetical protein
MRQSVWLAVLAAAVLVWPAQAQTPAPGPSSGLSPEALAKAAKVNEEIVGLFKDLCLDRFPNDDAVRIFAEGRHAQPMSAAEVRSYLRADPGHGWHLTTPLGLYAITIEEPPVRACAVRRMTPSGMSSAANYLQAITAFAKDHGLTLEPTRQQKASTGGVDITAFASVMKNGSGAESEQMILFLTNYHGRSPPNFAPDAQGGVGVEVRLVRQPLTRP